MVRRQTGHSVWRRCSGGGSIISQANPPLSLSGFCSLAPSWCWLCSSWEAIWLLKSTATVYLYVAADMDSEDIGLHLKILSLLENPAVIVAAAAAGTPIHSRSSSGNTQQRYAVTCTCCYRGIQLVHVVTEVYNHLYML